MTLSKIKKFGTNYDSDEIVARAKDVNPIIDVVNAMTDGTSTAGAFSSITVDTIAETTSGGGVTIDSVALKDGGITLTTSGAGTGFAVTSTTQTATNLCTITTATAVTTASSLRAMNVAMTSSGVSTTNMIEVAKFSLTSAVKNGNWINAVVGQIDLSTAGYATGLAGVICGELDLPSTNPAGGAGTYTVFEGELSVPATFTSDVPVSFINLNVWGDGAATFDTNGYIMDITGVTVASGKVFQANTAAAATHALRIRVAGTPYYIMLTDSGA